MRDPGALPGAAAARIHRRFREAAGASYPWTVELDDLKFAAIGVLLAVTGVVALLLALTGVASGVPVAAVLTLPGIGTLVAAHQMSPSLPATVRLARGACVAAAGVWAVMCVVATGEGTAVGCYLMLVSASLWGRHFLDERLRGPWWARNGLLPGYESGTTESGWIEVLPDSRIPRGPS